MGMLIEILAIDVRKQYNSSTMLTFVVIKYLRGMSEVLMITDNYQDVQEKIKS